MKIELTPLQLSELIQVITTHIQWLGKDLPPEQELPPKLVRLFALISILTRALD